MERILLQGFKGRLPRVAPKLLPQNHAQTATNCDLRSGNIKPFAALNQITSISGGSTSVQMIDTERFVSSQDCNFVHHDVDDTRVLIVSDGVAYPKQYTDALYPADHRRLGVVPPSTTLTINFNTIPGVTSTEVSDNVSYVYTYVTSWGEESAPSPATPAVDVQFNQYVTLTNFDSPNPTNKNDVTDIRIYRLATGTLGAEYQFLEEVDDATSSYNDYDSGTLSLNAVQDDLLETEGWIQPPDTLSGLLRYANGMLAGFDGNELYLSEPMIVYAWPNEYVLTFDSDIVGIAAHNEAIIVITETKPYIVTGTDPANMMSTPVPIQQACVSKRGIIETNVGVMYPSPDGLILVDGVKGINVTKEIITKEQWADLDISNLVSFWYDDMYIGFFDGSDEGFTIFDGTWIDIDLGGGTVVGGYVDADDDKLYLIMNRTTYYIEAFNDHSSNNLTYIWKSGTYDHSFPSSFSCAKIYGALGGAVTFRVYGDGAQLTSQSVSSQDIIRLPSISRYYDCEIYITGSIEIESITLGVSPAHLRMG